MKIIQYKYNRFYNRLPFIQALIQETLAEIICIQETHVKDKPPYLKHYDIYSRPRIHSHASGGVYICVQTEIMSSEIKLNTHLETTAVQIPTKSKFCICNIYVPPNDTIAFADIENIINQLPQPFILVCEFNAHNPLWGSRSTNAIGKIMEKALDDIDLYLLNDNPPTYFCQRTNSFSSIDLVFCSTKISTQIAWNPLSHCYSSDHIPILLDTDLAVVIQSPSTPKWKFDIANWDKYREQLDRNSNLRWPHYNINALVDSYIATITDAADISISKRINTNTNKYCVLWWNTECSTTIKN